MYFTMANTNIHTRVHMYIHISKIKEKGVISTELGITRRVLIQVLSEPDVA